MFILGSHIFFTGHCPSKSKVAYTCKLVLSKPDDLCNALHK